MSRCGLFAVSVAAAVAALDLLVKQLAQARLAAGSVDLGVLSLALRTNTGVAFSLGAGLPAGVVLAGTALLTLGLLAATVAGWIGPPLPAGLVLGGAVANVLDRAVDGAVTDYLAAGWFPTFNLADTAITIGALGLVWATLRRDELAEEVPVPGRPPAQSPRPGGTTR